MRMSTGMMYQQNMNGITGNQSLFMKAAEQLSSGKRVINPSDDPLAASRAVMLSQSQAENSHAGAYFRSPKRLDGRNGIGRRDVHHRGHESADRQRRRHGKR